MSPRLPGGEGSDRSTGKGLLARETAILSRVCECAPGAARVFGASPGYAFRIRLREPVYRTGS